MDIGECEDEYLTNIDYSSHYAIDSDPACENVVMSEDPQTPTEVREANSNYFSLKNLNEVLLTKGEGDLFVMHINAVSLVAYFDEIESLISAKISTLPDILCVSETRFKNDKIDFQTQLTNLPHYDLIYDNSPTNAGGVAIYVKETIKYNVKKELRLDVPDCESVFLELEFSDSVFKGISKSLILGCVYRHPRPSTSIFTKKLEDLVETLAGTKSPTSILGDININLGNLTEKSTIDYVNMLTSNGYCNLINDCTRFGRSSSSILDHIITDYDETKINYGVIDYPITDHLPIFALLKGPRDQIKSNEGKPEGNKQKNLAEN